MLSEAGSGTAAALLKLIVRLKLHGEAAEHPAGAVMVYRSVTENGLGSLNDVFVKGPSARIAVKVSVDRMSPAVCVYSPFVGSFRVVSTIVKPEGEVVPGLTLIELRYGLAPNGDELPCSVTAIVAMPPLPACTVIVLESSAVAASGGLPVALAVIVHVAPSGEPATATDPLPVPIVLGVQPAPKQSPIDIVVADAPAAQSSAPEPRATAVRNFPHISTRLPDQVTKLPSDRQATCQERIIM